MNYGRTDWDQLQYGEMIVVIDPPPSARRRRMPYWVAVAMDETEDGEQARCQFSGVPVRVISICMPYIAVEVPLRNKAGGSTETAHLTMDTRPFRFTKPDTKFIRAFFALPKTTKVRRDDSGRTCPRCKAPNLRQRKYHNTAWQSYCSECNYTLTTKETKEREST